MTVTLIRNRTNLKYGIGSTLCNLSFQLCKYGTSFHGQTGINMLKCLKFSLVVVVNIFIVIMAGSLLNQNYFNTFLTLILTVLSLLLIFSWLGTYQTPLPISIKPSRIPSKVIYNLNAISGLPPLILLWTPSFGGYSVKGWGILKNALAECPYKCEFTTDRKSRNTSAALIYHFGSDFDKTYPLPSQRPVNSLDQIWVFYHLESPVNEPFMKTAFDGVFNWTMTYRHDSDIPWPPSGYSKRSSVAKEEGKGLILGQLRKAFPHKKNRTIGWMNSHPKCTTSSQRELLVTELAKYNISVDIYGDCGPLNCSQTADCYGILSKQYKYWLAFENSICADYITEKMFNAQRVGMLPIVYGNSNTFQQFGIPHSFINILDFHSIQSFAEYLINQLDSNVNDEYFNYFQWTKYWRILDGLENINRNWCTLCTKLHLLRKKKSSKWYESIHDWFYMNGTNRFQCQTTSITNGTVQIYDIVKVFDTQTQN